jgi:hypothetical protein
MPRRRDRQRGDAGSPVAAKRAPSDAVYLRVVHDKMDYRLSVAATLGETIAETFRDGL